MIDWVGRVIDTVTEPAVAGSVLTAVVIVVGAHLVRLTAPAFLIWPLGSAAGAWLGQVDVAARAEDLPSDVEAWISVLMLAALSVAIGSAWRLGSALDDRMDLALAGAAATIGIYACVPETDLLRMLPGPVVVAAAAAAVGWARPLSRVGALTLLTCLAAIAIVDGQTRESAMLGSAGCLAAVSLLALRSRTAPDGLPIGGLGGLGTRLASISGTRTGHRPRGRLLVTLICIAVCSRVGGVHPSTTFALITVVTALIIGGVISVSLPVAPVDEPAQRTLRG